MNYIEYSKGIQETTKAPDSGYSIVNQYYKDNLLLEREEHFFYCAPIGIMNEYDHSGKLIRELNYELIFKYLIKDVAKFLFARYKIDIFKDKNFGILRQGLYTQTPYYEIELFSGMHIHIILLNGITGQIISEDDTTIKK